MTGKKRIESGSYITKQLGNCRESCTAEQDYKLNVDSLKLTEIIPLYHTIVCSRFTENQHKISGSPQ